MGIKLEILNSCLHDVRAEDTLRITVEKDELQLVAQVLLSSNKPGLLGHWKPKHKENENSNDKSNSASARCTFHFSLLNFEERMHIPDKIMEVGILMPVTEFSDVCSNTIAIYIARFVRF